jgi:hypothetical protein
MELIQSDTNFCQFVQNQADSQSDSVRLKLTRDIANYIVDCAKSNNDKGWMFDYVANIEKYSLEYLCHLVDIIDQMNRQSNAIEMAKIPEIIRVWKDSKSTKSSEDRSSKTTSKPKIPQQKTVWKFKLTKEQAGYYSSDKDRNNNAPLAHSCNCCIFFDPVTKECSEVQGDIDPQDSCNWWTNEHRINTKFISAKAANEKGGRLTKTEAGFVKDLPVELRPKDNEFGIMCNSCTFFHEKRQGCYPVMGTITKYSCCNYYNDKKVTNPKDFAKGLKFISGEEGKKLLQLTLPDIEDLV